MKKNDAYQKRKNGWYGPWVIYAIGLTVILLQLRSMM